MSRFRDTRTELGGPDGGSGGGGGDVVLVASHKAGDLSMPKKNYKGGRGGAGGSASMDGRRGEAVTLRVPLGTTIHQVGMTTVSRASQMEPMKCTK